MSSKLNSEGTGSPSESSPPAAHLRNNPAFMCRNRSSSTLPLRPPRVLQARAAVWFSHFLHLNTSGGSSPPPQSLGSPPAAADKGGLRGKVMEPRRGGGALTERQRGALMEAAAGRWRGSGAEGQRFPESSPDVGEVNAWKKKRGSHSPVDPPG